MILRAFVISILILMGAGMVMSAVIGSIPSATQSPMRSE